MKRLLLLIMSCFFLSAYAQETHTVSGYIKDAASGEALIGASIFLEEVGKGAATNVYGYYSFTVPSGSYLGFAVGLGKVFLKVDSRWRPWICGTYLQWPSCYVKLKGMARLKLIHR